MKTTGVLLAFLNLFSYSPEDSQAELRMQKRTTIWIAPNTSLFLPKLQYNINRYVSVEGFIGYTDFNKTRQRYTYLGDDNIFYREPFQYYAGVYSTYKTTRKGYTAGGSLKIYPIPNFPIHFLASLGQANGYSDKIRYYAAYNLTKRTIEPAPFEGRAYMNRINLGILGVGYSYITNSGLSISFEYGINQFNNRAKVIIENSNIGLLLPEQNQNPLNLIEILISQRVIRRLIDVDPATEYFGIYIGYSF